MDRKDYLTLICNIAQEAWLADPDGIRQILNAGESNPEALQEMRAILHPYIQPVLQQAACLEDFLKHSMLKDIPNSVWADETTWDTVLIGAAYECLQFDSLGVMGQIAAGKL